MTAATPTATESLPNLLVSDGFDGYRLVDCGEGRKLERFGRFQLPISGGCYFRLYPGALFRRLVRRAIGRDGHYIMYLHSWEFDPEMPRFKIPGFGLGFRHYNNLSLTLSRMRALVGMLASMGTRFLTISEFLEELPRVRL